jgi:antitoxin PrlF
MCGSAQRGRCYSDLPEGGLIPAAIHAALQTTPNALTANHYLGNVIAMAIAQSRVTAQGQISVPAEVRKKLGIGPGSVLEWHEQDGGVVVRRAGRYSSAEVHQALFPRGARKVVDAVDVKAAIRKHIKKRHAGG